MDPLMEKYFVSLPWINMAYYTIDDKENMVSGQVLKNEIYNY